MVTALLVTFVVLLLSIFVVNLSIHSVGTSSYDRNRVLSISAAEAGVNDLWSVLRASAPAALPCASGTPELTGTLDTFPGRSTYAVYVTYYDKAGGAFPLCADPGSGEALSTEPAPSQDHPPTAAKITSIGTTDGRVPRKVESYVRLTPVIGSGFNAAIISENGLTIRNKVSIDTPTNQSADIYVNNGDLCVSQQETFDGSIYISQGSAYIANSVTINGQLWARNTVGLPQGTVNGDVRSSTGAITTTKSDCGTPPKLTTRPTGGTINGGDAWAASPTNAVPPIRLTSGTTHFGQALEGPLSQPLPKLCWDPVEIGAIVDPLNPPCKSTREDWVTPPPSDPVTWPYTVHDFTGPTACTDAKLWMLGGTIGDGVPQVGFPEIPDPYPEPDPYHTNTVVRIHGVCPLVFDDPGVQTISFNGDLSIYTDASIWLKNQTNWRSVNGEHGLYFIVGYQSSMVSSETLLTPYEIQQSGLCGTLPQSEGQGPGIYDVEIGNSTNFGTPWVSDSGAVKVTMYSPCRVLLYNRNNLQGQVFGGTVLPRNSFTMTYDPLVVPGASQIVGSRVQVVYLREVA